MSKVIGIDIGGTSIKGGFVENDVITNKISFETHIEAGLEGYKDNLYKIIKTLLDIEDVDKIGISSVGNVNNETGEIVGSTNHLCGLNGFNIINFVKEKFNKKAYVDNDGFAALYGELYSGNAKGYKNVCMITLGTGVGGAVAINGRVFHGKDFTAGRIGHMMLYPEGKKCFCGRKGCVETYLSGKVFLEGARELGYDIKNGSEVFDLIKDGNEELVTYSKNFFKNLAYVIESLENIYNPDVVIIGGGLSNSFNDWKEYLLPLTKHLTMKVLPAKLGNNAGIIGASWLTKINE